MKKFILFSLLLLLLICQLALGATYYMRGDGSAANKAAATSCSAASTSMNVTTHNAQTFSAGDVITLCDNGSPDPIFRGAMTIPSSGSAGNVITYTNSGSPIISGSVLLNVSGNWSQPSSGGSGSVTQANTKLSLVNGTAFIDLGATINLAQYVSGNPLITICSVTNSSQCVTGYLKSAGTGETYGSELLSNTTFANTTGWNDYSGGTLTVGTGGSPNSGYLIDTYGTGISAQSAVNTSTGMLLHYTAYIGAGVAAHYKIGLGEYSSPYTEYVYSQGSKPGTWTQYGVYGTVDSNDSGAKVNALAGSYSNSAGDTLWVDAPSVKQVTAPSSSGVTITSTAGGSTYNWASNNFSTTSSWNDSSGYTWTITGSAIPNVWQVTDATAPLMVYFNNTLGTKVTYTSGLTNLTSVNQWTYNGTTLYVYSSGGNPATAFTSPGIEAGSLGRIVDTNNNTYLTFTGLDFRDSNTDQGDTGRLGPTTVTGITFNTCTFERGIGAGLEPEGSSTAHDFTVNNCTFKNNGAWGILIDDLYTTATVTNSTFTGNGWNSVVDGQPFSDIQGTLGNLTVSNNTFSNAAPNGCIGVGNNSIHCHSMYYSSPNAAVLTAYGNTISGNTDGDGIKSDGSLTAYDNWIYGNAGSGFELASNSTNNVTHTVTYNVVEGNGSNNIQAGCVEESGKGTGALSITLENNTCYNPAQTVGEVRLQDNITAFTAKNNIFNTATGGYGYSLVAQSAATIDYNLVYGPSGSPNYYNGAAKTWAAWKGLGFDTDGVNSNPLFTNGSGSYSLATDFMLLSGSPAIRAGAPVGLTNDYAGVLPQLPFPSMGAYEFTGALSPLTGATKGQHIKASSKGLSLK